MDSTLQLWGFLIWTFFLPFFASIQVQVLSLIFTIIFFRYWQSIHSPLNFNQRCLGVQSDWIIYLQRGIAAFLFSNQFRSLMGNRSRELQRLQHPMLTSGWFLVDGKMTMQLLLQNDIVKTFSICWICSPDLSEVLNVLSHIFQMI